MVKYVALLRGINVGGDNIIKMTELKGCFESLGLADVATYIQSENVLFSAAEQPPAELASQIEAALSERFGYDSRIVLRSHTQLRAIIDEAPAGFGSQPDLYRYDVVFLREPLTAAEALAGIKTREGVDQAFACAGVCYFSPHQPCLAELPELHHRTAELRQHDHSQLEHDGQAPVAAGRPSSATNLTPRIDHQTRPGAAAAVSAACAAALPPGGRQRPGRRHATERVPLGLALHGAEPAFEQPSLWYRGSLR